MNAVDEEMLQRVRCIIQHCQNAEKDGMANSQGHVRAVEQDARAIEDLLIDGVTDKPVHV